MNDSSKTPDASDAEYRALVEAVGVADAAGSTLIEISGGDRASFLHNLCTNEIRGLNAGEGCEIFLTDVRGKTLGHGVALCGDESIVLATVPGQGEKLIGHLDRYLIREDVTLSDRSGNWRQILLVGPRAAEVLQTHSDLAPPAKHLGHVDCQLAGVAVNVCRTDFYGPIGFVLRCREEDVERLAAALAGEVTRCGPEAAEKARLEAGTPLFGVDITENNLPQEIDRNDRAISFTKGCYLGQETVARLDALGHVNRKLCAVRFDGDSIPAPGTVLVFGEETVGHVTSAVLSPRLNSPLALAQIKRGHWEVGHQLSSDEGAAQIVAIPVI